jgi:hypothetical protein
MRSCKFTSCFSRTGPSSGIYDYFLRYLMPAVESASLGDVRINVKGGAVNCKYWNTIFKYIFSDKRLCWTSSDVCSPVMSAVLLNQCQSWSWSQVVRKCNHKSWLYLHVFCFLWRMRESTILGPCGRAVNLPVPLVWGVRKKAKAHKLHDAYLLFYVCHFAALNI